MATCSVPKKVTFCKHPPLNPLQAARCSEVRPLEAKQTTSKALKDFPSELIVEIKFLSLNYKVKNINIKNISRFYQIPEKIS